MADGSHKNIEEVQVGNKVLTTDPARANRGTEPKRVDAVIVTDTDKTFIDLSIQTPQGTGKITTTDYRRFWSESRHAWYPADDLWAGEKVKSPKGTAVVVHSREYHERQRTYDLSVEGIHTYYVLAGDTPVLVHNCGGEIDSVSKKIADHTNGEAILPDGDGTHFVRGFIPMLSVTTSMV
jgi:Pretoxin HINT domain